MRCTDPANRWLWAVPLTSEELAEERRRMVDFQSGPLGSAPERFTCDDCAMAPRCTLAFDGYNTDGDCLYEK